ncbi:two-component system response regulator YesN [Paenibacillus cellulosilyticus]|uniref:Two-component system response regulator YesN n=1 Tax=Paenibacillus cellulosilyticus TaxID=375489 RepID=A0A2V2YPU3_9BACL|nr:response regulator [Paenibacillus cellulosilyticus]PWV98446.1 two-component system response regulator YesN [Paenibacillus cellulosilyticus]QKS43290.1 response regulator [Paenibacillus cellulosilyticus]
MFTALIAEDSKPILRNIKTLLESSELPVQIAATAYNGEEALHYIKQHPVDILLTDIRMPKLDGLGLIEQAKQLYPALKVVLISSYSDFEYTRKAINLQVFDYLLKPVDRNQLVDVMSRVIDSLAQRLEVGLEPLKGIVASRFLADLRLGPAFFEQSVSMFLMSKQPFVPDTGNWQTETLQTELEQACKPHNCWLFPAKDSDRYIVIVQSAVQERVDSTVAWMESVEQRLLGIGIEIAMAGNFQAADLGQLQAQYDKLKYLLDEEILLDKAVLLDTAYRIPEQQQNEALIKPFTDMIEQRQPQPFHMKLGEQLRKSYSEHARYVDLERLVAAIADAFVYNLPDNGPEERLAAAAAVKEMLQSDSYSAFCDKLLDWCARNFELLHSRNRKSGEELFEQMDSYVKLHKSSQLSINDLAAKFHVSPSYISRIIKRFTNTTFVQYYMDLKIEEACKQLQAKPDLKIKELADALSFSDQHYFSRVFKDHTGFSPSEYKEKYRPAAE